MRDNFSQTGAFMTVTTPFGADALMLDALEAREGLSELFHLQLALRGGDNTLDACKIIGQTVTVKLQLSGGPARYFSGIATRFAHTGGDREFAHYRCEVSPKLWLLTLSRNRAIWQSKTVLEIIKAVLGGHGITFSDKTSGSYTALTYCVQYDESDFDFISRLMEQAGIFYFFTFASGSHTLVLADASSAHTACSDGDAVRFLPETGPQLMIDTIARFELEQRLVAKTFVLSDFDPTAPSTALKAESAGTAGEGEQFDWPGGHTTVSAGQALAKLRVQAAAAEAQVLRGDGYVYPFTAGTKFTLSGHYRSALNTSHVLRRVIHTARDDNYHNHFEAFAATVPFRAPTLTPRPKVQGSQTAIVVGPKNEEIWCDKDGRIKIKFHWDRVGKSDDTCSCWVRVAQPMAGAGFGALFLPRVGQEVVVTHVDGDPDRPLVTGAVYNGEHAPPVTLPAHQTQSTFKTRSSKQGTAGNEIRFEDKKDAEELYFHAQKDMKVEIEEALTVTLTKGAETRTLTEGDLKVELKKGNETRTVTGKRTTTITEDEALNNDAAFKHTVKGNYTLKVSGDLTLDVTGNITIKSGGTVSIKAGSALSAEAGTEYTAKAGTGLTNKAGTELTNQAGTNLTNKAGMGLVNQAGTTLDNKGAMITHKASAMQTVDGGGMLTVKGGLVKIN
ncbi:type VI secretion system Vgr family protein [Ideonella livida]|uniref:Type VI secretion system tip protein VgrG n=1 Tax=Ideonella livida TaxID=2707176 RepID=A0A7C9TM72_9BURK|nr:type VI secretion system tip protein TssI/VgrG [Ideonella livida]NDY94059.1 type VI secretion system tip protein VgrG [Ideonella livida]